jgi:beta-ureidopropionase
MIEPYQAIGLVPTMWGIRRREDIRRNLEHLDHLVTASTWRGGLDLPVRLVAIPEGALQGFNDEVLDVDHETFARECAIDIPGPETDELGRLARKWGVFVMAQAKARHPDFPGCFLTSASSSIPTGRSCCATTSSCRCCRWSIRSRRTTSMTAGSSSTAKRSTRSIPWPTPRSGGWAS